MAYHVQVAAPGAGQLSYDAIADMMADIPGAARMAPGVMCSVLANGGSRWMWLPTGTPPPAGAVTVAVTGGVWVQVGPGVSSVTATAPVTSTGGPNPRLAILAAAFAFVNPIYPPYNIDMSGATDANAGGALSAAIAAITAMGLGVLLEGTPKIATPTNIPSNAVIASTAASTFTSTVAGSGFTNAMFIALATNYGTVASTTLAAGGAPKGGNTLNVASSAGFVAGQSIWLPSSATGGLTAQQFMVVATGVGTITTDDPVEFTFSPGDTVETFNPPSNIQILGQGATAVGSGGALFEMESANRSTIADWNIPTTTVTSYVGSWDTGSRDCQWLRMHVNGGGTAVCLAIESGNRCKFVDCTASYGSTYGLWASGSVRTEFSGCKVWKTPVGFECSQTVGGDVDGCQKTKFSDCDAIACATYGIYQQGGSALETINTRTDYCGTGTYLQGVQGANLGNLQTSNNTSIGLYIGSNSGTPSTGIEAGTVTARGNGNSGIWIDTGAQIVQFAGAVVSGQPTGINIQGAAQVSFGVLAADGCSSNGMLVAAAAVINIGIYNSTDCGLAGGAVIEATSVCDVTVGAGRWRKTLNNTGGSWFGINSEASGATFRIGVTVEKVGSPTGTMFVVIDGAGGMNLRLEGLKILGTVNYAVYTNGVTGSIVRWLTGNSIGSAANNYDASTQNNRGNVTTTTAITFPIDPEETILLQPNAATSAAYISARTNGSGFSISCAASTDYVVL